MFTFRKQAFAMAHVEQLHTFLYLSNLPANILFLLVDLLSDPDLDAPYHHVTVTTALPSLTLVLPELGTILKKCIIDTITITHFFLIIDTTTITLKKIILVTITNTEFS